MNAIRSELAAARAALVPGIPELRVGDTWNGVFGTRAVILKLDTSDEEWPWPMVTVRWPSGREEVIGGPAFRRCELVERGEGAVWSPAAAPATTPQTEEAA